MRSVSFTVVSRTCLLVSLICASAGRQLLSEDALFDPRKVFGREADEIPDVLIAQAEPRKEKTVCLKLRILEVSESDLQKLLTSSAGVTRTLGADKPFSSNVIASEMTPVPLEQENVGRFVKEVQLLKDAKVLAAPELETATENAAVTITDGELSDRFNADGLPELKSGVRLRFVSQFTAEDRARIAFQFESRPDRGKPLRRFSKKAYFESGQTRVFLLDSTGVKRELAIFSVTIR